MCSDSPICLLFKTVIYKWVGMPDFWEGQVEKYGQMWKKSIFPGLKQGIFQLAPEKLTLHLSFDQIVPSQISSTRIES